MRKYGPEKQQRRAHNEQPKTKQRKATKAYRQVKDCLVKTESSSKFKHSSLAMNMFGQPIRLPPCMTPFPRNPYFILCPPILHSPYYVPPKLVSTQCPEPQKRPGPLKRKRSASLGRPDTHDVVITQVIALRTMHPSGWIPVN